MKKWKMIPKMRFLLLNPKSLKIIPSTPMELLHVLTIVE